MIDVNMLDKIQQLDEIESFFPLSKTRNFYLKNPIYHIKNLDLYSVVSERDHFFDSTNYFLYIGCIDDQLNNVYHIFLKFVSFMLEDSVVHFYTTEYVKNELKNYGFTIEPGYYQSLREISNKIVEKFNLSTISDYSAIFKIWLQKTIRRLYAS